MYKNKFFAKLLLYFLDTDVSKSINLKQIYNCYIIISIINDTYFVIVK